MIQVYKIANIKVTDISFFPLLPNLFYRFPTILKIIHSALHLNISAIIIAPLFSHDKAKLHSV